MDPADLMSFFREVERGYHVANPYHTAVHAADVTQAIYVFTQHASTPLIASLTATELLATLVAAMCHDLDHPGRWCSDYYFRLIENGHYDRC